MKTLMTSSTSRIATTAPAAPSHAGVATAAVRPAAAWLRRAADRAAFVVADTHDATVPTHPIGPDVPETAPGH